MDAQPTMAVLGFVLMRAVVIYKKTEQHLSGDLLSKEAAQYHQVPMSMAEDDPRCGER